MPDIIVRVKTKEQFRCIPETKAIRTLIVDASCLDLIKQKKKEEKDRKYYLQFPDILKESKAGLQEALLQEAENFDGLVVRNFDQLGLLRSFQKEGGRIPEIIGDSFLYSYNPEALAFYRDFFPAMRWVLSDELTDKEAQNLIKKADMDDFHIFIKYMAIRHLWSQISVSGEIIRAAGKASRNRSGLRMRKTMRFMR